MGDVFLKLGLGFLFLTVLVIVISRSIERRSARRQLNKMAATFGLAAVMTLVIFPWFMKEMAGVANRPLVRAQQQLAAKQAEAERKDQAERESMREVHRLVREGRAEDELRRKTVVDPVVLPVATAEVQFDKEGAWLRWYKRPAACAEGNSVECGNDYIRKRREFEALVSAGKIR